MPGKFDTAVVTIGIDPGKNILHLVGLDARGEIVLREKVARTKIVSRLANVPPCLIGIEAGMGTHYVTRELLALDHDVRRMGERSRRRVHDLVTQLAFEGLSENEIGRARISMMARSDLLHARAGYRSARPTTVLKIQLATHGRSIQMGQSAGRTIGQSLLLYLDEWTIPEPAQPSHSGNKGTRSGCGTEMQDLLF